MPARLTNADLVVTVQLQEAALAEAGEVIAALLELDANGAVRDHAHAWLARWAPGVLEEERS